MDYLTNWKKAVNLIDDRLKAIPQKRIQDVLGIEEYKGLNDAQYQFVCDIGSDLLPIGFQGAVGGGKSFSLCFKVYVHSLVPDNRLIVFRKYQTDLIATTFTDTWLPFCELLGGLKKDLVGDKRGNPFSLMENDTRIFWKGLFGKTGSKVEKSRLGSTAYGGIYIDEAQELADAQAALTLLSRLRWPKGAGYYNLSMVYNPPREAAWLEKHRREGTLRVYECPVSLNVDNLPKGYIERMKKLYPTLWKSKFLQGKTGVIPTGLPAYEVGPVHLRYFNYNPNLPLVRSWDFGSQFAVCLFSQYDNSPRLCLLDMLILQSSWTRPLCQEVKRVCIEKYPGSFNKINVDFCDGIQLEQRHSSSEFTNKDIMIQEGLSPIGVAVNHDVRQERINDVLTRLVGSLPYIVIHEDQHDLYSALAEGYCVDEKGKIIKDGYYEHIGDAFTFLVIGLLGDVLNPKVASVKYSRFSDDMDYYVGRDRINEPRTLRL